MRSRKDAVSLACQIVYEYDNWGAEHVSDMMATYDACGDRPPCTGDELMDLCMAVAVHKKNGLSYAAAGAAMLK